jgi:hypothetical protein
MKTLMRARGLANAASFYPMKTGDFHLHIFSTYMLTVMCGNAR